MRILPVLDLKDGVVVRGVAGRRQEYRPIVSQLTTSCLPLDVAHAFRDALGLDELYFADLDAIAGAPPSFELYRKLRSDRFRLWIDAGVRHVEDAITLADAGIERIVVGLETVTGPESLMNISRQVGGDRVVFSLDLRDGVPLGDRAAWNHEDAETIAARAVASGVRSLIVLDLSRVGVGEGIGTEDLCRRLARNHPELLLVAGGGVRNIDDLRSLHRNGIRAALVASALHDKKINREELTRIRFANDRVSET